MRDITISGHQLEGLGKRQLLPKGDYPSTSVSKTRFHATLLKSEMNTYFRRISLFKIFSLRPLSLN